MGQLPKTGRRHTGEILASAFFISIGDEISLTLGERHIKVKVAGIFRS